MQCDLTCWTRNEWGTSSTHGESLCESVKVKQLCDKTFSVINALWHWPWDLKSIGYILDSCQSLCEFSYRYKGKAIMWHKPFFSNQCIVTMTFGPQINKIHPGLMRSFVKFHNESCKGKAILRHIPFPVFNASWPYNFSTTKSKGPILDPWGVFVSSFICTCIYKGKQLCDINYFSNQCIVTLTFGSEINKSWVGCVRSLMKIGVEEAVMCCNHFTNFDILIYQCIVTLTFDLKSIGHILNSWGVCVKKFMPIGVKGKRLCD